MYTFTSYQSEFGKLTNNIETVNLTLGIDWINDFTRQILMGNGGKWWFLEGTNTITTVASQQSYILPQIVRKVTDVYVTVGTTVYTPIMLESEKAWARVLQSNLGTGDRPLFVFKRENRLLFAPTPASNGNTITVTYRKNIIDLSVADYTTGTIAGTLDDETITGSGTTFTAAMVNRKLRATSGDMQWYDIASFTDTTHLELLQDYTGATFSGSNFIIGQTNLIPESYQKLPLLRAVEMYWTQQGNVGLAQKYRELAESLYDNMVQEAGEKFEQAYMPPIDNMIFRDPNIPEPDVSTSSFT